MITHTAVLLLVLAIAETLLLASAAVWHVVRRKRALQALRASEDLYRGLVDACPDAIFHLTLEGTIVTANRQLATLFGHPEVPLGTNAIDFVVPEQRASARQQLIALVSDGVHRGYEYTCIRNDAGRFPAEISTALIRDGEGRPQSVVGLIRDVSGRKRAEGAVIRARAFLERLVDALPSPVFVKGRDHRFIMVNDALCTMLGRPRDALLGRSDQEVFPAAQADLFVKMDDAVFATRCENVNEEEIGDGAGNMRSIVTRKAVFQDFDGSDVLVGVIEDITERKITEERIRFMAQHDALTGLPNRDLLRDRVEQALRRSLRTNAVCALMMLDLDQFKEVNDTFGHQVGDALLKEVARRLTACVRESDTVSRLGGDEFVVLLAETATAADVKGVARKILIELTRPFLLKDHRARIGASMGISVYPKDGMDFDSLLRAADEAMYRVKEAGRNNFAFAGTLELTA